MVLKKKWKIPSSREILKSLPNARREWNSKTALDRFYYLYGIGKVPMDIIRMPVFKENVEPVHWTPYALHIVAGIHYALIFYAFGWYLYIGNIQKALPCHCMAGAVITTVPMIVNWVNKNRFKLQSLIEFGGNYIYLDNHENTEFNRICKKHMDATMRSFIIKMTLMVLAYGVGVTGPLYAYLTYGIKSTTIEVRIPFVEDGTDTDFVINMLLMQWYAMIGGLLYIGLEVYMALISNIVKIMPDLVRCEFNHLVDQWQKKTISRLHLTVKVKNIVQQSNDADEYARNISDVMYWRNLIAPIAFTYAIGIGIYCQFSGLFFAGYGMAVMSWVQLFFICDLCGSIQDSGFAEALYDVNWQVFPLSLQKDIMHLINLKQNQPGIKLGPFNGRVNRETFKIITKNIYTIVMFLINFFN